MWDPAKLLRVLDQHGVEYLVVGGMAAVLQGAPVNTLDLDIVYARTTENVSRLKDALDSVGAVFRTDARCIPPAESHLRSTGHKLLTTRFGNLDVLGTIEDATEYEDLVPDSDEFEVEGLRVRVLSLERLIRVKEQLNRPKDQFMLTVLRATAEERKMGGG